MIQVQGIDGPQTISRIELADIIKARYDEIFDRVYQELNQNGALANLYHGVVLTGDASQIEGAVSHARRKLGVSAHLGNPPLQVHSKDELLPALRRSIYTTASGLLMFSQSEAQDSVIDENQNTSSIWKRIVNSSNDLLSNLKNFF
jgi:cell division protein FtsA